MITYSLTVFTDCLITFLEMMALFLRNSKHKSITSNSIPQTTYIQVKIKLSTQNNSVLLEKLTLLKPSKTHTHYNMYYTLMR